MNTDTDKQAKRALVQALKMKFDDELKSVTEKERPFTKAYLAQKLHDDCRFDLALCNQTLDAICAELFPEAPPVPPPPDMTELAAAPAQNRRPRRRTLTYILLVLIAVFLAVLAVVLRPKAKMPPAQEDKQELQEEETQIRSKIV